jgi:5-methylthioadenosine/S-adenosylhomocysteine deaminase
VHLSPGDRDLLAAAGGAVAHCPGSNLKLASGALHWEEVHDSGVRLGIGTDGCSSSNDLDMWQAMRQAALLARLTSGRPDVASATEVLRAATIEGARALGLGELVGSVEVGKRADLVLLDLSAPHLTPVHDVAALLVFAAGRGDVTDVLVDGRVVVRDRRSTVVDTDDLLARARARGDVARAAVEAL